MSKAGVKFGVDPPIDGLNVVRIEVSGFVDEEGPQLSLTVVDPKVRAERGDVYGEVYHFFTNDMDAIAAFFRDVEIARQDLPPHLRLAD